MTKNTALVVGVTGISGSNVADLLLDKGWDVYGLARRPPQDRPGVKPIAADLMDPGSVKAALADVRPSHVFFCTWARQDTEEANCRVNGAMLRDPARRRTGGRHAGACRSGHRAEALPRPVRILRKGEARYAVQRGAGAPALPELLLCAGGHPVRGGRQGRLRLVGAPAAHVDRLGARQRHEHGRDPRRLCRDLQGDGQALRVPGHPPAARGGDRRDRRPPSWRGSFCGPRPRRGPPIRPSTSSTGTCSAGAGCGGRSPPTSASRWGRIRGIRCRSRGRWRGRSRSGIGSSRNTG